VFFVDSRREKTSTARDHVLAEAESTVQQRRLNDGREFQVYKIFYDPADLELRLRTLGWDFTVAETPNYFIYGSGTRQRSS
jgi:demethylmenaquinone methyltransferase/2-methoxy-6-polyprenyl-1,4-benzoquinol methylase